MGHRKQSHSSTGKSPKEGEVHERRHHNFTIELFLDEMGKVSDIFIDHDQSAKPEKISSWEPEKLIDFIAQHAGLAVAKSERDEPTDHSKRISTALLANSPPGIPQTKRHAPPSRASADLTGTPLLRELCVVPVDSESPTFLLLKNQPFSVYVTLDLTEVVASRNVLPLVYDATIIAKQLGGPERTTGKAQNRIGPSKKMAIGVPCTGLPEGMYRFSTIVKLAIAGTEHDHATGAVAYLEGGDLIEVY